MASILSTPTAAAAAASLRISSAFPTTTTSTASCLHLNRSTRRTPLRSQSQRCKLWSPIGGKLTAFRCSAVTTIGQSEFSSEVLGSDVPVLVEFVADWCGPCRLISPIIEWAFQEYEDKLKIVKIDHDTNPQLIEEYKVYGLPCLILFKNGKEIPESRREGAITKVKLKEYLDSLLGSTSVV